MKNNKLAPTPTTMGLKLTKEECTNNVNPTLHTSMVGRLIYFIATRLDLMYATSLVSRFMETSKETHWLATKRNLRYVNGIKGYGILYTASNDFRLVGYTHNDWT